MKKKTKNILEYIGFRVAYSIFRRLPIKVTSTIISNIFVLGGMVFGIRRDIAEKNLAKIYPDLQGKELKDFLKKMYYQMGQTTAETYFADYQKLFTKVKTVGKENAEEALARGKGLIIASAHMGNWELAGRFFAKDYKLSVIYKRLRNNYVDSFTNKLREELNVTLIEKKVALRKVLKLLKEEYIVTIMIDQNARKQGIEIDFMGYPASTFVGTAKIALKTNTPIITGIAIREDDNSHTIYFGKIIEPSEFNKEANPIQSLTQYISKEIESYIEQYPTQWFWVHRRWRGVKKNRKNM